MCRSMALLTVGFLLLSGTASQAQNVTALQLYGSGVHAYYSLDYARAHEYLTAAIKSGVADPRCYYFRGLCYLRLGRPDEAKADFLKGAELERTGSAYDVGHALERIQGADRAVIEQYRLEARLVLLQQSESSRRAREDVDRQSQRRVMAESVPAPAPAPAPVPVAGPAAAPAGTMAAPTAATPAASASPAPFEEPAKVAPAAAAPAATATMPAAAPAATTETPAAAPAAKPAATAAAAPAAKTTAEDPFAAPAAQPAKPAEKATPAEDPFGAAAPKTDKAAPKATAPADDPFGAPATPAPKKSADSAAAGAAALAGGPAAAANPATGAGKKGSLLGAIGKALGHAALDGDAGKAPAAK